MVVVGARPQFVKAAAFHRAWVANPAWEIVWVHTGQHHDEALSAQFFAELGLPEPDECFDVRRGSRGTRMGDMMAGVQRAIAEHRPDAVLVFGDTDSTLAGAWAATAEGLPLIHIEAGLRSGLWSMPEEVNRVLTDRMSNVLVCPSDEAVGHLSSEGITHGWPGKGWPTHDARCVWKTGDIMHDNALHWSKDFPAETQAQGPALMTMHRPSNVDDASRLWAWIEAIGSWAKQHGLLVKFPVHPRTAKVFQSTESDWKTSLQSHGIEPLPPLGYQDTLRAIHEAPLVLTDSGGVQKEAYSLGCRCVVMRSTTEWVGQVREGQSVLVAEPRQLESEATTLLHKGRSEVGDLYGDGCAAQTIVAALESMWA